MPRYTALTAGFVDAKPSKYIVPDGPPILIVVNAPRVDVAAEIAVEIASRICAQISMLLGHSTIAVTQRYLNTELDLASPACDRMGL